MLIQQFTNKLWYEMDFGLLKANIWSELQKLTSYIACIGQFSTSLSEKLLELIKKREKSENSLEFIC